MACGRRTALILAIALAGVACRTVPIPPPTVINVPPGLTGQEVEVAVIAGILNTHPPRSYDPTHELSQADFDAMLVRDFLATAHGHSWFPEARQGDIRYATVDTRGHYLRVAIHMNTQQLRIEIVESRNLMQSDGVIHKTVISWIANLEGNIRRELGRMASYGSAQSAPPQTR
ncbi:MAG TPA: hypothetical protein VKF60_11950 [Myxococcota bacterium]|nr:hypothetical protein [Myxococcota bacterium]